MHLRLRPAVPMARPLCHQAGAGSVRHRGIRPPVPACSRRVHRYPRTREGMKGRTGDNGRRARVRAHAAESSVDISGEGRAQIDVDSGLVASDRLRAGPWAENTPDACIVVRADE